MNLPDTLWLLGFEAGLPIFLCLRVALNWLKGGIIFLFPPQAVVLILSFSVMGRHSGANVITMRKCRNFNTSNIFGDKFPNI